jgi:hypothetical protein
MESEANIAQEKIKGCKRKECSGSIWCGPKLSVIFTESSLKTEWWRQGKCDRFRTSM